MTQFVPVARVGELGPGQKRLVWVGGQPVVLVNVGDTYYAVGDVCPHQGASLAEGWLHGDTIRCAQQGWAFHLRDGRSTAPLIRARTQTYDVRAEGGEVLVSRSGRAV